MQWLMSAWTCFLLLLDGAVGAEMACAVESSEMCESLSESLTLGAALLQTERNVGRIILSADEAPSHGHYCCLSAQDDADECGTCWPHEKKTSSHWCGESETHCGSCSGIWCRSGTPLPTPAQAMTSAPVPAVTPAPSMTSQPVTESTGCCLSAEDIGDQCGTCRPGDWAKPNAWCAASEANCVGACSGAWCTGSSNPVPLPEPESEQPAPLPTPQQQQVLEPAPVPTPTMALTNTPTQTPTVPSVASTWVHGTWTTGYWDCCKPSCSWPNKGSVSKPILSCDASTGKKLTDANIPSVCDGGSSASCADNKPVVVAPRLSMGFAAIAVSGSHGLTGDANCGQCFELKFTDTIHSSGNWGGSHPDLVGKSMVVQVSNIGYDVSGDHSFDLQIPGAGQGIFTEGCTAQFPGTTSSDFDCDNNYGGCDKRFGCARLPQELRAGCEWRYDWYRWLAAGGQTNNPFVDFRRVRCPEHLTNISGSLPDDDSSHPAIDFSKYA